MAILQVLHLVGSAVSDFYADLSRLYAQDCLIHCADPTRYQFHIAYITPDRLWRFPSSLDRASIEAANPLPIGEAMSILIGLQIDVMVPQMFCIPGMTHYRALFDLLEISYVGNSADLMAFVADKAKTKTLVAAAGVKVPAGEVLRRGDRSALALPVVIKPMNADNSIGVTLVKTAAEFQPAWQAALEHSPEVLIEPFIELGREVRCGVIEQAGQLVSLPLEEYALDTTTRPIRSYADKLKQNETGELDFAAKSSEQSWIVDPQDPLTETVGAIAKRCHLALGCRHYSLFDFRIDPHGQPWFLEAGLYCSFAEASVLSAMVNRMGLPLQEFFHMTIQHAMTPRS